MEKIIIFNVLHVLNCVICVHTPMLFDMSVSLLISLKCHTHIFRYPNKHLFHNSPRATSAR